MICLAGVQWGTTLFSERGVFSNDREKSRIVSVFGEQKSDVSFSGEQKSESDYDERNFTMATWKTAS